jgi:hypothetical protein
MRISEVTPMAYGILESHRKPPFVAAATTFHLDGLHGVVKALNALPLVRREEARFADWERGLQRSRFGGRFADDTDLR